MKNMSILKTISLLLAILGLIFSTGWVVKSGFEYEPIIVFIGSLIFLVGYYLVPVQKKKNIKNDKSKKLSQDVNVHVNVNSEREREMTEQSSSEKIVDITKEEIYDIMKKSVNILFIDDDKRFKVVKLLKDAGWKNTKTVIDIKSLDDDLVRHARIYFVDIHGVGKKLQCPNEGLDLALMLKKKYPEKKVVIYSADKKNDIFHDVIRMADYILEKNALPYEFQSLVENYSLEFHKRIK